MIGTKLYVDFSTSHALEENLKKLKQLLGDRGRVGEENKSTLKTGTNKGHFHTFCCHLNQIYEYFHQNDLNIANTLKNWKSIFK